MKKRGKQLILVQLHVYTTNPHGIMGNIQPNYKHTIRISLYLTTHT